MKLFLLFFVMFTLVITCTTIMYPQSAEIVCNATNENSSLQAVEGGLYKPSANASGEYFRALFVFAQFQSDTNNIPDWPKNSLPVWANNIIDSAPSSSYRAYTISDYFKRMSKGQFDFIGDIHPNIITVSTNKAYYLANIDVINTLKTQITDFKRYDNWYFSNGRFYFSERNADTYFDMLIIVYRWANFDWFQLRGGIAKLGFSTDIQTADGIKFSGLATDPHGSGITSKIGRWTDAFNITIHFAHEYGQYLFGGGHTAMGGLMMGEPWDYNGTYAMKAWEREKLGYIPIADMYNGQPKTIYDYVTTGDAVRVRTNPNDPNEYFILENHHRVNYFDQIIRGGALQGAMDQMQL